MSSTASYGRLMPDRLVLSSEQATDVVVHAYDGDLADRSPLQRLDDHIPPVRRLLRGLDRRHIRMPEEIAPPEPHRRQERAGGSESQVVGVREQSPEVLGVRARQRTE